MPAIGNGIGLPFLKGGGGAPSPNPDFVSVWDTTKAGSASDTVVLPLLSYGTYSGTVDWGDGTTSPFDYANRTHVYASSGIYTITISDYSNNNIGAWRFQNGGDKLKIIEITNWGLFDFAFTSFNYQAFRGCKNLNITATDIPVISGLSLDGCFNDCDAFNNVSFSGWDVSNIANFSDIFYGNGGTYSGLDTWDVSSATNFFRAFFGASVYDDISGWDVSNVTNMSQMFYGNGALNCDLASWNIVNVSNFANFMIYKSVWSTVNYDATLIGWEATLQAAYPSGVCYPHTINIHFGGSHYTAGGAADTARTSLISNFGWTITDGGSV